jgi:putative oxidoreductase
MRLGAVLLRAVIGPLFVGHGTQKLFGWFGGHGLEGTGGFLEALGLRPGRRHAAAAGTAEAAGGALLTLGFLTPVATTVIASTMITAIRTAHAGKGPWVSEGGYEYNLVLIAAMAALAENGPGPLSVDSAVAPSLKGTPMALFTLGAGVAGSYLATSPLVVESAPQPSVSQQPEGQADGAAAQTAASSQ